MKAIAKLPAITIVVATIMKIIAVGSKLKKGISCFTNSVNMGEKSKIGKVFLPIYIIMCGTLM